MLMGLTVPPAGNISGVDRKIAMKMSKSKPDTAIFMTDTSEEIKRKFNKAYCPEKIIEENPVMEYARYIVFERFNSLKIERPQKFGGDLELHSYQELCDVFTSGQLHPMDLKVSVAQKIDDLIRPVREHFEKDPKARELLARVQGFETTR